MKQTQPLNFGNIHNRLMGNNSSEPVVGEGATKMMFSDRYAYTVLEVSKDKKSCKIRECDPLGVKPYEGYAEGYSENLAAPILELRYRNGAWRVKVQQIVWVDGVDYDANNDKVWDEENCKMKLVDGLTRIETKYHKVSIIFGRRDYYRDPHF